MPYSITRMYHNKPTIVNHYHFIAYTSNQCIGDRADINIIAYPKLIYCYPYCCHNNIH